MRNSLKLCLLGLTPLHEAANFGFPATTKILLKHGANIDATTKSDCAFKSDGVDENTVGPITALQDACSTLAGELLEGERSRKLEVIQILLEYNANTLLRNAQNKTPLQAGFITVKFLYSGAPKTRTFFCPYFFDKCPSFWRNTVNEFMAYFG